MTEERFNISRRKALGALGTIGVASAGAGLGTSAYFSDQETFENNQLTAGTLDMKVDWEEHYYDGSAGADLVTMSDPGADTSPIVDLGTGTVGAEGENITLYPSGDATKDEFWDATSVEALPDSDDDGIQDPVTDPCGENSNLVDVGDEDSGLSSQYRTEDSVGEPLIALDDVKPGDFGEVTFSTHLCTNPGYLWMTGDLVEARENGVTEPEAEDADENGATDEVIEDVSGISGGNVELLDQIQVRVWYDDDCDNQKDGNEMEEWSGNLGEFLIDASPDAASSASADDRGIPLDGTRTYEGGLGGYDDFVRLGVNHLDLSDDGDSDVVFEDATDPAGTSEQVVYGHSVGGSSQDYATTVAALPDVTLQDIADGATLTYDYYHGPAHGHAAPDEVWLLLEHPDGTRTTVRRTSNDDNPVSGSARTPESWYTRNVHNEILGNPDFNGGYNWFDADGQVAGGNTEDLTSEYDPATKILRVGIGLGSTSGAESDIYYRNLTYDGDDVEIPTPDGTRGCFPGQATHCFGFQWWVPIDHGNEIQGDSVAFDVGFYTEQCRHNDGTGMAPETATPTPTSEPTGTSQ
ncbi:SipW-dependent-type signal peptide-containing protein [Salinirarus marinus]|uniref:SipW-dependent-type signal peptide-containing protein n=1 Tax=Salinirarus marinus TaxID=3068310 RepID=UPI003C6C3C42